MDKIPSLASIKKMSIKQLPDLCKQIRESIITTLSQVGGHLASNLGSIELTVALHYVFKSPVDKICWDVGHQCYTHKILTGRQSTLHKIRTIDGPSGFPRREESQHDNYNTGHAGTSISQALGEAIARDKKVKNRMGRSKYYDVIAVTGDASVATGMSFEALNHAGAIKSPFLVVLNDNEMSISQSVGALNYTFNRIMTEAIYKTKREQFYSLLKRIPWIGVFLEKNILKIRKSIKGFFVENHFFEALGFRYLGPIDGHDVIKLVKILRNLQSLKIPTVLHVITMKGKGYKPAEQDPVLYHGVKPFKKNTGQMRTLQGYCSLSNFVGYTLSFLASKKKEICVITPAMKEGSGLVYFAKQHPGKFFDVGIAEQHAVTLSGALAKAELIPFLCIYSTFLQRGYDQLIHDVALMNLPVKLVIDRAGCVGEDGETHQGIYDIAYLSCIPNIQLLSPSDPQELLYMLTFMVTYNKHPIAIRFPKKSVDKGIFDLWLEKQKKSVSMPKAWSPFKANIVSTGRDAVLFTEGTMLATGLEAAELLKQNKISLEVVALKSIRPLDNVVIKKCIQQAKLIATLENHVISGGVGQQIQCQFKEVIQNKPFISFGFPNKPIEHGSIQEIEKKYKLTANDVAKKIRSLYESLKN